MPPTSSLCLLLLFALISVGNSEPSPPALSLVVAVDVSGSAQDSLPVRAAELVKFSGQLIEEHPDLEIALVSFARSINLVQDFTRDRHKLERATLGLLRRQHPARLYSAVWISVEELLKDRKSRRVLLIVSDGNDVGSEIMPKAALQAVREHEVEVFTLGIEDPPYPSDLAALEELSEGTGGLYIRSSVSQLPADLARIAESLRQ